jgi:hypothetical protein
MKDWKALANAGGFEIPPRDVDRVQGPLSALEEAFRPLVKDLTPDIEPAPGYHQEDNE